MNIFEIIGIIAGLTVAIPSIPQIYRTIKTKNVKGLSPVMYYIRAFGGICRVIYGTYLGSRQMEIFNSIGVILSLIMIFLIRKYK